jgi:type I restriction enzyme, R subunit
MPKPSEHETVQARILEYAHEVGWTIVPRAEAERRRVRARTEDGGVRNEE